jgi:hypothetical protein
MRYVAPGMVLLFLLAPSTAFSNAELVRSWQYKDAQLNIVADFLTDGTFRQVTVGSQGRQTFSGRYQLSGQSLNLQVDGGQPAVQAVCRFADDENSFDPNTIEEYKTREWKRTPIRKR